MKPTTIQDYIDAQTKEGAAIVTSFVSFMEKQFPTLKATISFSMPMWKFYEKMRQGYVAISTAKQHFTIHILDDLFLQHIKDKQRPCKFGKGCIKIAYEDCETYTIVCEELILYMQHTLTRK